MVASSVSWEDPFAEEPTQSITMTTDSTHFPPNYVTCFPTPVPSAEPTTVTDMPSQMPSIAPTTMAPTVSPTTVAPTPAPQEGDLGLFLLIGGVIGTAAAAVAGFFLLAGSSESYDDDEHDHYHPPSKGSKHAHEPSSDSWDWFG